MSPASTTPAPTPTPTQTSIAVSPSSATLTVGGAQQFNATAKDENGNPMAGMNISWTSNNLIVGSITPLNAITGADGTASATFTGIAAGTAIVNATNGTVVVSAIVTVTQVPSVLKGDANRNNKRDTGDATLILRSIVGLPIPMQYQSILPLLKMLS